MSASQRNPESAWVPRAGERVLAFADFLSNSWFFARTTPEKDCFGATPKPARETRALPRTVTRSTIA
jgi:hypothetical protein